LIPCFTNAINRSLVKAVTAILSPPTAGHSGYDGHFVSIGYDGVSALQGANLFVVDEDVDVAFDLAGLVAKARFYAWILLFQIIDDLIDGAAAHLCFGLTGGVTAQRTGYEYGSHLDLSPSYREFNHGAGWNENKKLIGGR
jgi:hypothetical protein